MRREAAPSGGNHDDQQRDRRTDTARRHQPAEGITRYEEEHQHHAERCAGADPQHFRACHRVAGQTLDNAARYRQHHPGNQRGEDTRRAPRQQLIEHCPARPVPALGITAKRQRRNHRQHQYCATRQGKPQDMMTLGAHFIARVHRRGAHAAQAWQQPQQQRRANQRRDRTGRDFHPYPRQPEDHLVRKPEDQGTNQRGEDQPGEQTARPEHFCQQRREQADKTDDADRIHQQGADDNRQRQRRQTGQRQRQTEVARHAIVQPHQGKRAQQQQGQQHAAEQLRPQTLNDAPVGLCQRPGAPEEHALQLVMMEDHQQLVDRAAVEAHHQPGEDQRHRREAFTPGHAKDNRADDASAHQRGKLRRQYARERPQRDDRHPQLGTRRHAKGRRLCQRIT